MAIAKKLATLSVAAAAVGAITIAAPVATHAATEADISTKSLIDYVSSDTVEVRAELNCTTHLLSAKVKNASDEPISPEVTFNDETPGQPMTIPIQPDEERSYNHYFNGNNQLVEIAVDTPDEDTLNLSPFARCDEPTTFTATETSKSAVVGTLRNNSTLVPQTVYISVGGNEAQVEHLDAGESRLVALPFSGTDEQMMAHVTMATDSGYESYYTVDLTKPPALPGEG